MVPNVGANFCGPGVLSGMLFALLKHHGLPLSAAPILNNLATVQHVHPSFPMPVVVIARKSHRMLFSTLQFDSHNMVNMGREWKRMIYHSNRDDSYISSSYSAGRCIARDP